VYRFFGFYEVATKIRELRLVCKEVDIIDEKPIRWL
jgi:hypothetical protein